MSIDLRSLLHNDFGIDFPITGGMGNSIENPIVILPHEPRDTVGVEHEILRCLSIGRGVQIKVLDQRLLQHEGRMFDRLRVQIIPSGSSAEESWVERYYFDITEVWE
jgi:hypothetical protein